MVLIIIKDKLIFEQWKIVDHAEFEAMNEVQKHWKFQAESSLLISISQIYCIYKLMVPFLKGTQGTIRKSLEQYAKGIITT